MWLGFYSEEHLVCEVVEVVINALPPPVPLPIAQYPIGLEMTSMDIINMLRNNKRIIGI